MAKPSITTGGGEITFLSLRGAPQRFAQVVEDLTRMGVDGHAYRKTGRRAAPFELIGTRDCLNKAQAVELMEALQQDAQGTLVEFKDDFDVNHTDVMLLSAELLDQRVIAKSVGGVVENSTVLVVVRLVLQKTAVPA